MDGRWHAAGVVRDISGRKQVEEALRSKTHQLHERVKELSGLYAISRLMEKSDMSLNETLQGVIDLIPPAWQYPETTCAKLTLQDREFKTKNYKTPVSKQTTEIIAHGKRIGFLEAAYIEEAPESDEGPFMKEERRLIDTIAERLGQMVELKEAETALKESEEKYRLLAENTQDVIWQLDLDLRFTYVNPAIEQGNGIHSL